MKEFATGAAIVCGVFALLWFLGSRKWDRQAGALAARRPNPTKEEFVTLLASDAEPDIAPFLWDELRVYWQPELAPHPDDDFLRDLPIDSDEPNDWLRDFCKANGLEMKHFPVWPQEQPATVRNFARWLSKGRRRGKAC